MIKQTLILLVVALLSGCISNAEPLTPISGDLEPINNSQVISYE